MITKRFMAPLLASLVLGLAAAPAQAATVSYSLGLISTALTFSGPQGGALLHDVDALNPDPAFTNEFNNGIDDGNEVVNYGITSTFTSSIQALYSAASGPFIPGGFSFFVDNRTSSPDARDFRGAGYEVYLQFLLGDAYDIPFDVSLSFDLGGDLNIGDYFLAQFFLSDSGTEGVDIRIGDELWLSTIVPDSETSQIGGTPGGGTDVPEPGSLALLGLGLLGLGAARRVRRTG